MIKQNKIFEFNLPKFSQIPNIGLYLAQVVEYLNNCLRTFGNIKITNSMVSNYVKHKLISPPTNRLYSREQIAELLFIAIAKNVMEQDDLKKALKIQKETYSTEIAYDYFVLELKNALLYVFRFQNQLQHIGNDNTKQKEMLHNLIMSFAYREYLYKFFRDN